MVTFPKVKIACVLFSGMMVASVVTVAAAAPAAAAPVGPTPPGLDHFKCYSVDPTATTPLPSLPSGIRLKDQFGELSVKIGRKPNQHCNPTQKFHDGAIFPINNPRAHLVCHAVTSFSPIFNPRRVAIQNQFIANVDIEVVQPTRLCLPAWKNEREPVFPDELQPPGLDHFLCYSARVPSTFTPRPALVRLFDQFEAVEAKVAVKAIKELCNPVQKTLPNGQVTPVTNPAAHLVCFRHSQTPLHTPRTVFTKHQLGIVKLTTRAHKWLCVPSFKQEHTPAADV